LLDGIEVRAVHRRYRSIQVDFCGGRKANGDLTLAAVLIHSNVLTTYSFRHRARAIADHLSEAKQQIFNFVVLSVWCANRVGEIQTLQVGFDVFARVLASGLVNGGSGLSRHTDGRTGDRRRRRASGGWIKTCNRRPERGVDVR
jgi:hypothetical protein